MIRRGLQRFLVALHADEADARVGHQLKNRIQHPETGAEHGHD